MPSKKELQKVKLAVIILLILIIGMFFRNFDFIQKK